MVPFDVVVVGAGPAGIGVTALLKELGVERMVVLEKETVGATFDKWPKEMQLITPSFTTNFYGHMDLNSIVARTSPAFMLRKEHPTGQEYARYLREVSEFIDLPVIHYKRVELVHFSEDRFTIYIHDGAPIQSRFLIWAAGEFQYPNTDSFPGAELCLHNSQVNCWENVEGNEFSIIGGYESGIDAAIHLSRMGKRVRVFDREARWATVTTDPSENLSPFTVERLKNEMVHGRIELIGESTIDEIQMKDGQYFIHVEDHPTPYQSSTPPILATGFKSSLVVVKDLFHWEPYEDYCLLNEEDESTKTPGLFLVGPQVRHEDLIFCFIYKFRQRFGVVANAIGNRLGKDTSLLEPYRSEGLFLDDLSCCGEECVC